MIEKIDQNFNLHSWKIIEQANRMDVHHLKTLTYTNSGLSCDTFNIIHILQAQPNSDKDIQEAIEFYQNRQLEYCLWVTEENLTDEVKKTLNDLGLSEQNEEIGMVLNLNSFQSMENPNLGNIEIVDDEEMLRAYANVIAKNWSPLDENVITYYNETSAHYLDPENKVTLLIYYHGDTPVSTVELFPTDNQTIGIYGFTTLSEYRGQGIGSALLAYSLNYAKEKEYENAILQATEDGIGLYEKVGFESVTTYFEFA